MDTSGGDEAPFDLLLESISLEPSFVNAYASLAAWFREGGRDAYDGLRRVWEENGNGDQQAFQFIEQYRDGDPALRLAEWCRGAGCGPALIVQMSDDLTFLDLYDYQGAPAKVPTLVGRIRDPRLICSPRDFGSMPASKRAIAEDSIKRGKDFRIVSHRGTIVELPHRTVFGPTIDSVHFNAVLNDTIYRSGVATAARQVVEIGVGSGFLLCSTGRAIPHRPLRLIGSDIDSLAVATAERNLRHALRDVAEPAGVEVQLEHDARVLERLPSQSVDLLLTNPPYIPEREFMGDNAYGGTRVIESLVLEHGPRLLAPGGVAVMLFSSLASRTVQRYIETGPLVPVVLAPPRRVPLDVRNVGADASWIELLRRDHGLEEALDDPAYVHWHSLHMVALCRPDDHARVAELRELAGATVDKSPRP